MALCDGGRASKSSRPNFLVLPPEIRTRIYEYCLCVRGSIVPYPEPFKTDYRTDCRDPMPAVALLALNKYIRHEALPVLFGKNVWRITSIYVKLNENGDTLWSRYGFLITHVVQLYSYRDTTALESTNIRKFVHAYPNKYPDMFERNYKIHYEEISDLRSSFTRIGWGSHHIRNVKIFEMDIEELFCPRGCCRIGMADMLFKWTTDASHVKVIVRGVRSEKEVGLIKKWRVQDLEGEEKEKEKEKALSLLEIQPNLYSFLRGN